MWWSLIILVLSIVPTSYTANIVFISILSSPSHHFWNNALTVELAKRGHNLTVISPYFESNSPSNVHYILLDNHHVLQNYANGVLQMTNKINPLYDVLEMIDGYVEYCSAAIKSDGFKTLLNYPDDFQVDLIIHDFSVGSCFLPFLHKFKYPPLIAVSAFGHPPFLNQLIGGHHYYAYNPHFAIKFDDHMTFMQRFFNFLLYFEEYLLFTYYLNPKIELLIKDHFDSSLPPIVDLEQRTALAFVSTNPAMDYLSPLPENVISVGGLHIKEPKSLPQDLKKFIDTSKKGTVIVSFGSNFRSDLMPLTKQMIFMDIFRQLPDYHFVWKFESNMSAVTDLPTNVQIHSWLPVSDLLAKTKVKAIFFHGGLLTTQESLHHGVPMIIMPFGIDQHYNMIKIKRLGMAEGVDYLNLNVHDVSKTLLKVLEDPSYAVNVSKWSARFRDQKEKPLERAVWWVEWLLRNPDCDYLKSPVLRLGAIVGNVYDIVAFVVLIIVAFIAICVKLICLCICKSSRKSLPPKTIEKKTKIS